MDDASRRIKEHLPLVRRLVMLKLGTVPTFVERGDLYSAALEALHGALGRFEEGHGAKLETYLTTRIKGAILDALRATDDHVRSVRAIDTKARKAEQVLSHRLLRKPRPSEVAAEIGLTLDDYESHRARMSVSTPKMSELGENVADEEHDPQDFMPDPQSPEEELVFKQKMDALLQAMDKLDDRERFILTSRHAQGLSLREVGVLLGVSTPRVSQIEQAAIEKMRNWLKVRGW
jgi:RNA polymerase sigma factor for flagellar operon FliA